MDLDAIDPASSHAPSAYRPPRHVRIAALRHVQRRATDREDFLMLAHALDLVDGLFDPALT